MLSTHAHERGEPARGAHAAAPCQLEASSLSTFPAAPVLSPPSIALVGLEDLVSASRFDRSASIAKERQSRRMPLRQGGRPEVFFWV